LLPAGLVTMLLAPAGLFGQGPRGTTPAGRRIAVLLPETGPLAPLGELQRRGYNLAEAHLQQQGRAVQVRYFDTGPSGSALRQLIYQQVMPWQPDVVVGPYDSPAAVSAVQTLAPLEVPLLIPTAVLDRLTQQPHPSVFRVATPLQILSLILADFLADRQTEWHIDRIVLLGERTEGLSLLGEEVAVKLAGALAMRSLGPVTTRVYDKGSPPLDLEVSDRTVLVITSYAAPDCIRLVNQYAGKCRLVGFLAAFAGPDVRAQVRSLPNDRSRDVYCLLPWNESSPEPENKAFSQRYRATYRGPLERGWPDYHAAQAYSSLLVATRAVEEAERTGSGVTAALRRVEVPSPLGTVRFINFIDYYQQNPGSAVIAELGPAEPVVVYPLDRVLRLAEEDQPGALATPPPVSPLRLLLDNQMIALFVVLSLGLLAGQLKIKGVALGMAGIFFVGMPFGYFGVTTPEAVSTLGVIFLLYGVGLGAGPTFFRAFGAYGKSMLLVLGIMVLAATLTTLVFARLAGIPTPLAAGLFTGSMKSSAGFASAIDRLPGETNQIAVGYGISYPISLLAIVVFVQLAPRLLRKDLAALNKQMEQERPVRPQLGQAMVELANPAIMGKTLAELSFVRAANCRVVRVLEGDRLLLASQDLVCRPGLHVLVFGTVDRLAAVTDYLGRSSDRKGTVEADHEHMEVVLTASALTGKSLGELNPLANYGVVVREVSRLGHTLGADDGLVLQPLDVLQVDGPAACLQEFARAAGHRTRALQQTDMLSLATGIALGVILGTVPLGLPGSKGFVLGMAGGPMVVALLLSHFGRVGGIIGHFPPATQLFLVRLGLSLLLAGASVRAGSSLVAVFSQQGPILLLMSVVVSVVAILAGLLASHYWLRHNVLEMLMLLSGGVNATPAYTLVARKADSDIALALFTASYATAMILTVVVTQVVIAILGAWS
jgi:putative transport protein